MKLAAVKAILPASSILKSGTVSALTVPFTIEWNQFDHGFLCISIRVIALHVGIRAAAILQI